MGTWHEDQYTSLIISHSFLFTVRSISDRSCRDNQDTHFMFNNFLFFFFFRKSCRLWNNMGTYCRAGQLTNDSIPCCMRIACCAPKATETHSEYVSRIDLPLQQWLHERASVLRYTYIGSLIFFLHCSVPLRNLWMFLVYLSGYAALLCRERYSYLHSVSKM